MQEYASTVKSTDVGLPWEAHFKSKKQFELTDLKEIFKFCIQLLMQMLEKDPPYEANTITLVEHLLTLSSNTLIWGFLSLMLPKQLIAVYESVHESDQPPALRLTASWNEVMLSPMFLPFMFKIYLKVRQYENLLHHVLLCLMQLASLSGFILEPDGVKTKYIRFYMENLLKLFEVLR